MDLSPIHSYPPPPAPEEISSSLPTSKQEGKALLTDLNQFTSSLKELGKDPSLAKNQTFLSEVSKTILSLNEHSKLGVSNVSGKF